MKNMFKESHDKLSGNVKTFPDWCVNPLLEMAYIIGSMEEELHKQFSTDENLSDLRCTKYLKHGLHLANYILNNPKEKIIYNNAGLSSHELETIEYILEDYFILKKEDHLTFETMFDDIIEILGNGEESLSLLAAIRYMSLLCDNTFYGECLDFETKYRAEDLDGLRYFACVDYLLKLKNDQKIIEDKYDEIKETVTKIMTNSVSYQQSKIMVDAAYTMINNIDKGLGNKFSTVINVFELGPNIDSNEHFLLTQLCFNESPIMTNSALVTDFNRPFMDCSKDGNEMFKKAVEYYTREIADKTNLLSNAIIIPNGEDLSEIKGKCTCDFEEIYYSMDEYIMALNRYINILNEHMPKILDMLGNGIILFLPSFDDVRNLINKHFVR